MTAVEDIWRRYAGFFEEVGVGAVADFKRVVDLVESALAVSADDSASILARLMAVEGAWRDVEAFSDFYRCLLPPTVVSNLRADLLWLLERARLVMLDG